MRMCVIGPRDGSELENEKMQFASATYHEVRDDRACAYYNGVAWEEQMNVVCNAVISSGQTLECTASSLLRGRESRLIIGV